ncbi:MAG: phosphotransferase [Acidobacteria bacterium]|nr:phosphotransferase [Acidobacteriota bacterium]
MSPSLARLADARDNGFIAQAISPDAAASLLGLPSALPGWLARLDALPQTICHWDAHRANLVSREGESGGVETIALDWAGVGWGAAGTELSKLLSQTVNFFGLAPEALPALDARLFEHYVRGLKDEGWRGDERDVRFAYTAASAARLVVRTASAVELALNPQARAGFEKAAGLPFAGLAAKFRDVLPYYLSLVDEADRLAGGA